MSWNSFEFFFFLYNKRIWCMLLRIHCFVVRTFKQLYTKVVWHLHLHVHGTTIVLEHLSSHPTFSGVCITRFLVLYVCFVDRCLSFCTFSFGHCFVCSSSIYGFWLPLWYLQTLLHIMISLNVPVNNEATASDVPCG